MAKTKLIRADFSDVEKMRTDCKNLIIKDNPKLKDDNIKLDDPFIIKRMVKFFLDTSH